MYQLFPHCSFSRTGYLILSPLIYRRFKTVEYLNILFLSIHLRCEPIYFNEIIVLFPGFLVGLLKHILTLAFKISNHIFISISGFYFSHYRLVCNDIPFAIQYLNSPIWTHFQLN